jgi:hypothetical protein
MLRTVAAWLLWRRSELLGILAAFALFIVVLLCERLPLPRGSRAPSE